MDKQLTHNMRFGASGAVLRRKNWYDFCKEFLFSRCLQTERVARRTKAKKLQEEQMTSQKNGQDL